MTDQNYEEQLSAKQKTLSGLLAKHFAGNFDIFRSSPYGHRMRAEFRVWHDGPTSYHIMFDKGTREQYRVDHLPAACSLINQAMSYTMQFVNASELMRKKLYQIDYLASTTNELVISFIYHKPLDDAWQEHAKGLVGHIPEISKLNIIGRSKKQKIVIGDDFVTEEVKVDAKCYSVKQIENSFTQPNALINEHMIQWVIDNLPPSNESDLLELYCGAGNFTLPLSAKFRQVLATEISKTSVSAAQDNIKNNHIDNLKIARLSSEEFTEAYKGTRDFYRLKDVSLPEYQFSTVLVDPPRAGLDDDTLKLVAEFENIVYISCNPATLANNVEKLNKTHSVINAALFDQFPFTEHIETGLILRRIN